MARLRFCAYHYADLPLPELRDRWKRSEELGFDVIWNCDALNEPAGRGLMFEAVSILAAMAYETSTIRLGTLVNSLTLRNPMLVAKAAMTLDHLSNGRLELGFGGGVLRSDHEVIGSDYWPAAERIARVEEAVQIVDGALRSPVSSFSGRYYRTVNAEMDPLPVQKPRPPLTIAAHADGMLRIAARYGDCWSSFGGYGVETPEEFFTATRDRSLRLDAHCVNYGRDPRSIRRSLVCFPPLRPWSSPGYFEDMVGTYSGIGIDEFVLYWPQFWSHDPREDTTIEVVAKEIIPRLKKSS